jgi:hypothetical protein
MRAQPGGCALGESSVERPRVQHVESAVGAGLELQRDAFVELMSGGRLMKLP